MGNSFSGKTEVTQSLASHHGYETIHSGNYLLESLRSLNPHQNTFTRSEIYAHKQALVAKFGPLFMLANGARVKPLAIEGVRAPKIAQEYSRIGFIPVVLHVSLPERIYRMQQGRIDGESKPTISTAEELAVICRAEDLALKQLYKMLPCIHVANEAMSPQETSNKILEVFATSAFSKKPSYDTV